MSHYMSCGFHASVSQWSYGGGEGMIRIKNKKETHWHGRREPGATKIAIGFCTTESEIVVEKEIVDVITGRFL